MTIAPASHDHYSSKCASEMGDSFEDWQSPHIRKGVKTTMPLKKRKRLVSEFERLRRQVHTLHIKARSENTRRFKKRTSCVHLAPYEDFAKLYRIERSPTACCHPKRTKDLEELAEDYNTSEYVHLEKFKKPKKNKPLEYCGFSFFGYGCKTSLFLFVGLQ